MPDLKEIKEAASSFREALETLKRNRHATVVIQFVSILDYDLERCIKRKFRPLDKKTNQQLFAVDRPLGTFAAKINIAFALGITTEHVHRELHKIREIRNAFAHTKKFLSLDTEPVKSLLDKLKFPPESTGNHLQQFMRCAIAVDDHLELFLISMGETEDLRLLPSKKIEKDSPTP